MAETTQSYADQIISEISTASGLASVTNVMVGRILDFLNKRLKTADSDLNTATQMLRSDIAVLRNDLDALDHDNATRAIESFREILAFLEGCKDDETLLAKLTEIKDLIDEEASDLRDTITDVLNSAQSADELMREQIDAHGREFHYLPGNFATEEALFLAAGKYGIGSQPIKPGALLLGCVDECWGVYQYVYFNDEAEVSAQSDENQHAAQSTSQTIAPPAVKYDADVCNPDNWVRLVTVEDVNAALDALNIYNFGTLELDFTNDNWATVIPQDNICPQIDGIFAAWEAGKKIVGRFVVTKRVQQGMSSSIVTQPFDSFTIDYGGEDAHTQNPSLRFHCVSVDTSDTNIRVRSVRVYFSKYNEGEGFKYMYGASSMSQIDIPSSMNFNNWSTRLATLEAKAPTVEITDDDIFALLPSVEAGISTLELDEEQTVAVNAAPVNEKFEQFRAQLARELERGRKRMQFNNPENITENGIKQ